MAKIEGMDVVLREFARRRAIAAEASRVSVVVGYTAYYALYVHENLDPTTMGQAIPRPSGLGVFWGPNGQPKFLEAPFIQNREKYATIVRTALQRGMTLKMALLLAGLELQRDSQHLVPVEYGNLRASAFTRADDNSATQHAS